MKVIINELVGNGLNGIRVSATFTNSGSTVDSEMLYVNINSCSSVSDVIAAIKSAVNTYATSKSYSITDSDIIFPYQLMSQSEWDAIKNGYVVTYDGTQKTFVKTFIKNVTTTSGQAVIYLTDDGTSGGVALFTEIYSVGIQLNDSSAVYAHSYALTNSNKTLTISSTKQVFSAVTLLATLLLASAAMNNVPNGTALKVTVIAK